MLKHSIHHPPPPSPSSGEFGGVGDPTRFIEGPNRATFQNGGIWMTQQQQQQQTPQEGPLKSLALLSTLSLLLGLNSLIFLLKVICPGEQSRDTSPELHLIYELTLCLSASALSLNLCVLLLSAAQFFFGLGNSSFLPSVRLIRGMSTAGFLFSIPLFLSAVVLFVFTHLSLGYPALVATGFIGIVIVGGGVAMVWSVYRWQGQWVFKQASPATIELSTLV